MNISRPRTSNDQVANRRRRRLFASACVCSSSRTARRLLLSVRFPGPRNKNKADEDTSRLRGPGTDICTVPNDGCLNFVDENDEVLLAGFGRKGKAKGDIPGVRFKGQFTRVSR